MKRGLIILVSLLALLTAASCATTRRASVDNQRRGLLMLEGENIYKNKGFYNSKSVKKRHKKNIRAVRKNRRAYR